MQALEFSVLRRNFKNNVLRAQMPHNCSMPNARVAFKSSRRSPSKTPQHRAAAAAAPWLEQFRCG